MKRFAVLFAWLLVCGVAAAQAPQAASTPLVILVGGPAGTPGDTVARALSGPLANELGRPVLVENRPGAAGTVALSALARAAPDGLTLGIFALQAAAAPALISSLSYDTGSAFAPIRQLTTVSNVLVVRSDSAIRTLPDFLRTARERPLTYASGGTGTPAHLAAELFRQQQDLRLQHVPFNGPVAGITAVAGGHVDAMFATVPSAVALIQAGKVRAIALTGVHRSAALPEVPTMTELGWPDTGVRDWHGVVAPAGTPRETVDRLAASVARALALQPVQQRLTSAGLDPVTDSGPAEFQRFMTEETRRWTGVVRAAGITLQ